MATSVSTVFHGLAAGDTFTPAELRSGLLSRAGVVQDGSTAGRGRPGILPGAGTPLAVLQASTPAMKVKVKAGTVVQISSDSPGGVYTHTLTTDTDLDIGTAPISNTRWDVVVAKVIDNGSAPSTTIEVLQGSASVSPTYPAELTTPADPNTKYFPLAKIVVGTSVSTIVTANISKPAAAGGLPNFGQMTVAPGGLVPASSTTDAAGLPPFSQWILPSGELGIKHPNGTSYQYGNMERLLYGIGVSTNGSGDFSINTSVITNGAIVSSPFPNACFGGWLFDATGSGTLNEPVWFKLQSKSASALGFRAYRAAGPLAGATLDVVGQAVGW